MDASRSWAENKIDPASGAKAVTAADRSRPTDCIILALPNKLLDATFRMLPASYRFVSPVCRHFRDRYSAAAGPNRTNATHKYSTVTEDAQRVYFTEAFPHITSFRQSLFSAEAEQQEDEESEGSYSFPHSDPDIVEALLEKALLEMNFDNGTPLRIQDDNENNNGSYDCATDYNEASALSTVPPNYIIDTLPLALLDTTFRMLPASHRFISPVCRTFKERYAASVSDTRRDATHKYSATTENARAAYFEEEDPDEYGGDAPAETSRVGAGAGRRDWVERGGVFDETTCRAAVQCGRIDTLKWLVEEKKCPWDKEYVCTVAARGGHVETLEWARRKGCPWDEGTCREAARRGRLKLLQALRHGGCEWDPSTCRGAAEGGHLEVLKWVRAAGCGWDEGTCAGAARNGHFGVLVWARGEGCPWDWSTCREAAGNGHLKIFKWATEQGCHWDWEEENRGQKYATKVKGRDWRGWGLRLASMYERNLLFWGATQR
mmetsp:Transcript_10481/g.20934  ORF Transcript_10481/g.20934 Transcript_10481/m.20934 type:complete len:491 (+) Transcript_10481:160-1632(+)